MKKKAKSKKTKSIAKKKVVFKKVVPKKAGPKNVKKSKKSIPKKTPENPKLDLSGFNAKEFIKKMESAYDVKLPLVYIEFLKNKKFQNYRKIDMTGFVQGTFFLDFIDENLPDVTELGMNSDILDMDDCNWVKDYADFVPIAALRRPTAKEGSKSFMVISVKEKNAPVLLFDYEGWTLYPVSNSFQEFLLNLPSAKNDITKSFRPYEVKKENKENEKKNYWVIQREELENGKHKDIWENSFSKKKTDLPGTIQDLINLTKHYPKNTFLIGSIVSLALQDKDTKLAIEYIEKGLIIKSNCISLLNDLANQKLLAGDLKGALAIADQIESGLDTSEDDKEDNLCGIKAIRGMVLYKEGKKTEAFELLDEVDEKSWLTTLAFDGFGDALEDSR